MKPRVMLCPYLKGWSYDLTARALMRHLSHRFELRIVYQGDHDQVATWKPDLVVDFWWKGELSSRFGVPVLKQVSSHRWGTSRYGRMAPHVLATQHLVGCAGVVVPSVRLLNLLAVGLDVGEMPRVSLCKKGFEPSLMNDYAIGRRGKLTVGWAGAEDAPDKNVFAIRQAWSRLRGTDEKTIRIADRCLAQSEMGDFYNSLDIITCASFAEGDPRPLIEGMACGCFPVTTDVGIVPELVRHRDNGLIVDGTERSFVEAFKWCHKNLRRVRAAGAENAREMLRTRTWAMMAPAWGDAIDAALMRPGLR